jgi:hypothetical protein
LLKDKVRAGFREHRSSSAPPSFASATYDGIQGVYAPAHAPAHDEGVPSHSPTTASPATTSVGAAAGITSGTASPATSPHTSPLHIVTPHPAPTTSSATANCSYYSYCYSYCEPVDYFDDERMVALLVGLMLTAGELTAPCAASVDSVHSHQYMYWH